MKKTQLLLAIAILASMIASCGESADLTETTSKGQLDTTTEEPVSTELTDDLGEFDFEEDTFDMQTRSQTVFFYPLNVTEETGDIFSDSVMDENDQYGYTSLGKQVLPTFWIGANTLSITKNKDGELVYSSPSDAKFIDVYQKIFQLTWDDNIWHRIPTSVNREEEIELFREGKALFTDASCFQIANSRDSETDFGIVPYPKWDESQDNYYSRIEGCDARSRVCEPGV